MIIYQFAKTDNDQIIEEKYFLKYSDALAYQQDSELSDVDVFTNEDGTIEEIVNPLGYKYEINTIVVEESYTPFGV